MCHLRVGAQERRKRVGPERVAILDVVGPLTDHYAVDLSSPIERDEIGRSRDDGEGEHAIPISERSNAQHLTYCKCLASRYEGRLLDLVTEPIGIDSAPDEVLPDLVDDVGPLGRCREDRCDPL